MSTEKTEPINEPIDNEAAWDELAKARQVVASAPVLPLELDRLKSFVISDLAPVRPILPTGLFAAVFLLSFLGMVLLSARMLKPLGWTLMLPWQRVAMFTTLGAAAVLLAFTLSRQMVPGRRSLPPRVLIGSLFVLFCMVNSALFSMQAGPHFLRYGEQCLRDGFPYAIPAVLLFAYIVRRGAVLSPVWAAAVTGMLAGLVSTTALEIHCSSRNLWHILMFHFSIPAVCVAVGVAGVWIRHGRRRVTFWRGQRTERERRQ